MDFNLKRPCKTCPFLRGDAGPVRLVKERTREIIEAATGVPGATFSCHKTVDYDQDESWDDDDSCPRNTEGEQHCAGAILFSIKVEEPNQMTRIADRLGLLNGLDETADVFENKKEMLAASLPSIRRKRSA